MRSWKVTSLAATSAALLVFVVASMSSLQAADKRLAVGGGLLLLALAALGLTITFRSLLGDIRGRRNRYRRRAKREPRSA